jgi:hypothetical protein
MSNQPVSVLEKTLRDLYSGLSLEQAKLVIPYRWELIKDSYFANQETENSHTIFLDNLLKKIHAKAISGDEDAIDWWFEHQFLNDAPLVEANSSESRKKRELRQRAERNMQLIDWLNQNISSCSTKIHVKWFARASWAKNEWDKLAQPD